MFIGFIGAVAHENRRFSWIRTQKAIQRDFPKEKALV